MNKIIYTPLNNSRHLVYQALLKDVGISTRVDRRKLLKSIAIFKKHAETHCIESTHQIWKSQILHEGGLERTSMDLRDLSLRERFIRLTSAWKMAAALESSSRTIAMHPAYQRIIGMGAAALPLILDDLYRSPDHWFWALSAISGENPVKPDHRGNLKLMTEDWLEWGAKKGYFDASIADRFSESTDELVSNYK